jgi:hypothetical protein
MPLDNPGIMLFWQKCLGSPTKSTLVQAACKGLLPWPILTPTYIRKWYVPTIATSKGHLHRIKAGIQTTHPPISPQTPIPITPPDANTFTINISTFNMRNALHTDAQAAINKQYCVLIATVPRFHFIHIIAMPANPTNAQFVAEYTKLHQEYALKFPELAIQLRCHVSDNIIGKNMLAYFRRNNIDLQVVPPDNPLHRRNQAERAGETAKAHIISTVATCSPKFPVESVHLLLQHCELTLNIMRESDIKNISCWHRLRGPLDIIRHHIYPIGCPVAIYDPKHLTWAPRAEPGFYHGINLLGFRSHRVLCLSTMAERDSVTLDWLPTDHDILHYEPIPANLFTGVILPPAPEDAQFYEQTLPSALPLLPEGAPPRDTTTLCHPCKASIPSTSQSQRRHDNRAIHANRLRT